MRQALSTLALVTLLAGSAAALAQSAAPTPAAPSTAMPATASSGGYTGPSSMPLMSVKQLLDTGRDDQPARLQGRIVSHDGGERYTFADDSGRMTVEISAKRFPAGQPIGADQRVELQGELDKGLKKVEFEVKRIVPMP